MPLYDYVGSEAIKPLFVILFVAVAMIMLLVSVAISLGWSPFEG
jgi:hypothetical protein